MFRIRDQRWAALKRPVEQLLAGGNLEKVQKGLAIVDESRVRYKSAKKKG